MKAVSSFKKTRALIGEEVFVLYIKAIFIGIFWFITESSFILVLPGFLVSLGILNPTQTILPAWYPTNLLLTALILVLYGCLRSFIIFYRNYLSGSVGQIFNRSIRQRFLAYGLNNVQTIPMHEIISVFNERISQAGSVLQYFFFFVINLVSLVFFLGLGLRIAPLELVIGLGLLGLFILPFQKLNKRISTSGHELVNEWNKVSLTLVNGFKNFYFLKFYNLIDKEVDSGKKSLSSFENHYLNYHWLVSLKLAFPILFGSIVISLITYFSFRYWHTPGMVLLTFYYIFIRITQGLSEASTVLGVVKLNYPGFMILKDWHDKMNVFELETAAKVEKSTQKDIPSLTDLEIDLKNVSFAYHAQQPILKDINVNLKKSDILLIKGESGAGKSTLISLLVGFNHPTSGEIKINQQPLSSMQDSLLKATAYVGPEPFLIGGTVKENLLYGYHGTVTDDDLCLALEIAQLKTVIMNFDKKLLQPLNELTEMSTGQKQRLSLARGILRQPKLLILDEATANLDPVTESEFIFKLSEMRKNLIVVIISHKDSFNNIATHTLDLKKL